MDKERRDGYRNTDTDTMREGNKDTYREGQQDESTDPPTTSVSGRYSTYEGQDNKAHLEQSFP